MKKSKKVNSSAKDDFIKIKKPREDDGITIIGEESCPEDKYFAVLTILSEVFDYFKSMRFLSDDTISDIQFLVDEYIEADYDRKKFIDFDSFEHLNAKDYMEDFDE